MTRIYKKRGIPGVNSDAYHFGYFEDLTAHRNIPPKHTKYDSLLETIYLFLALLAIYILLTFILFAIREYTWSLKRRKKLSSVDSTWSNNSQITIQQTQANIGNDHDLHFKNPAYPDIKKQLHDSPLNEDNSFPLYSPLEDFGVSPITYSAGSLSDRFFSKHKVCYTARELYAFKPAEYLGAPLINIDDLKNQTVETAIKLSLPIQHVEFQSAWTAEKTIADIIHQISHETDEVSRKIAIYRLIVIGANSVTLKNSNIFLLFFSRAMDELIDTGAVFDVLNESNPYIARALIDVILQYCYSHKLFAETAEIGTLEKIVKWKGNKPVIQRISVLFRYLINLQLGAHTLTGLDADSVEWIQQKIKVLLIHFSSSMSCDEIQPVLNVLSQAVNFSETIFDESFFYELLLLLVSKHQKCCSEKLLGEENSKLVKMVQRVLLAKNAGDQIGIKCENLHSLAASDNPKTKKFFTKTETTKQKTPKVTQGADINGKKDSVRRPGSWDPTNNK